MKNSCLLLWALLGSASKPKPPVVRVMLSPLTKAAYEQARRASTPSKLLLGEAPVFAVRKQKGKLLIPTAAGNKLFKDRIFPHDEVENVTYDYLGYFPKHQVHIIQVAYY